MEDSVSEPADGAVVMTVQLAHGVHAREATSAATRQKVEALYRLPEDTVRLETLRDNSSRVRVVFTPSRHLEREGGTDWPGPVLLDNGQVPLADTAEGAEVAIPLYTESRVRHGFISGTSGAGKSVTSVSVMLPGLKAGIEVTLLVDGKRGTSTPYLRPVVSRYARLEWQWPVLIEIAYRVMKEREVRRGAAGLHEWRTLEEDDPIVTLLMDDVTAINRVIKAKHVEMVCEILEHGQAVGVRVIQITQSPSFEDIIGGVKARNLMTSGGWAVCHRAGGSGASRLTLDSTNVDVSLKGLPQGQAAITVEGQLVGYPAQVRNATKERVLEELPGIIVRHLNGADLEAAGPDYLADHWETGELPTGSDVQAAQPVQQPVQELPQQVIQPPQQRRHPDELDEPEDLPASRRWVLDQLARSGDGMTLGQLQDAADGVTGAPKRRTISNALTDLMARGAVSKHGAVWRPAEITAEAVDERGE